MADVGEVKYKVVADDSRLDQQIDKTEGKLKSKFGGAVKAVGAAAGAALAAGTAAVVSLVKQATTAYGEYEQLVGGVETLFGAGGLSLEEYAKSVGKTTDEVKGKYDTLMKAQDQVMQDASNAYKDAGLSANEYMEQVTSVAAALKQSSKDEIEAAKAANQAIIDMADNANKMGTPLESIQNAYAGFAKQNYTMLDNLKLGYGGTKQEMERLLADAQKLTGVKYNINNLTDVYAAIHAVQTELGITGTTAKEASTTLQGSMSMMQAAWQNLITGMADPNADIGALIGNMIDSAKTFLGNAIPIISQSIKGISKAIKDIAPVITKEVPGLIRDVVPDLLKAGGELVKSLGEGILKALPDLIPVAVDVILDLVDFITDPSNLMAMVNGAVDIIIALNEGLIEALPKLIEKAPEIIMALLEALIKNAPKLLEAGTKLVFAIVEGLVKAFGKLITAGGDLVTKIKEGFTKHNGEARSWGGDLIQKYIDGIKEKWNHLKQTVGQVASSIKKYLGFSEPEEGPLSDFHTYAPDMMDLFAKGISDNMDKVEASVEDVAGTVSTAFTADVGYNLPDIAGYAQDLTASMTAQASTEIIIPLSLNGREIARASAWYMNEQLAWEAR